MGDVLRIGLVGATGLVGQTTLSVLNERRFPDCSFRAFATERVEGRTVKIQGIDITVEAISEIPPELDYALFSIPGDVTREVVPKWRNAGIRIIDNSSVFRLAPEVPLVVPEVNPGEIKKAQGLVANPNCSTIQLAVTLAPLHRAFGLKRVSIATYQSVSGAGGEAVQRWEDEIMGIPQGVSPFSRPIHANVIPQIDSMEETGFSREELKMMHELKKILGDPDISVSATAVRVPVGVGHSEAVEVTLNAKPGIQGVLDALAEGEGIVLIKAYDDFLTPVEVAGKDEVFVSRVRQHPNEQDTFLLWVVADNLRKGAATNAVQIMERWMEL